MTKDLSLGVVNADVEKWIKGEEILGQAFPVVNSPVVDGSTVTFRYENSTATSVSLRGTMNDWNETP